MTKSLSAVFRNIVQNTNGSITFVSSGVSEETLSYAEMHRAASCVLGALQQKGVKAGDELVIQLDDNKTFLLVFWACVMGRIVPVPLSTGIHAEHKIKLVNVWRALNNPYITCDEEQLGRISEFTTEVKLEQLYEQMSSRHFHPDTLLQYATPGTEQSVMPDDLAYIQFSSGSTGEPKGVCLTHDNLLSNVTDITKSSAITANDILLSWMPLTHDMGMICFHLTALLNGLKQVLLPTSLFIKRPLLWMEKVSQHRASVLYSPNSGFQYFLGAFANNSIPDLDLKCVRLIYNGAEPISLAICRQFISVMKPFGLDGNVMMPGYGMAEASVAVTLSVPGQPLKAYHLHRNDLNTGNTIKEVAEEDNDKVTFVDVGYPVSLCEVRICGDDDRLLPEDTIGNIQIRGRNVTAGYYNNVAASEKVFTKDKWLRTGDIGWMHDGRLIITGRQKNIIIINGQNYYPQDIERTVERVVGIEPGKVVACGIHDNDKEGVLVFVYHKNAPETFEPLAQKVHEAIVSNIGIPVYSVIPVKRIPKTTSGKIQHFKLLEQYRKGEFNDAQFVIEQPLSPENTAIQKGSLTQQLLGICSGLLGKAHMDENTDLLAAGMNSIIAAQVASRVQQLLGLQLQVEEIFMQNSVAGLFASLTAPATPVNALPAIEALQVAEHYSLSLAQQRIWMEQQLNPSSVSYNIPVLHFIAGRLDVQILQNAILELISRYEILRTAFIATDDGPVQKVADTAQTGFNIRLADLRLTGGDINHAQIICEQEIHTVFKLDEPCQMRACLVCLEDDRYWLLLTIHHIISDGWSIGLLLRELQLIYNSLLDHKSPRLPEPAFQYKDYAAWQRRLLSLGALAAQKDYWLKELEGESFAAGLPASVKHGDTFSNASGHYLHVFPAEDVQLLSAIARKHSTTPFSVLMALLNALLYRYTNEKDLVLGFDVNGRVIPEFEGEAGYFLNTLCLRTKLSGEDSFEKLLSATKDKLYAAFQNQLYPFEQLIEDKQLNRSIEGNDLFNILVLYQNFESAGLESGLKDCIVKKGKAFLRESFVQMMLEFEERGEELLLDIQYKTGVHKPAQIRLMAHHLQKLLKAVAANDGAKLYTYDILTEEEKQSRLPSQAPHAEKPDLLPVHLQFEQAVAATPLKTAIVSCNGSFTYEAINEHANKLAHLLKQVMVIKPDDRIGILLSRNEKMVIAMLAVLKAGAAYVAIDPDYPAARCEQLAQDSGVLLLLVDRETSRYLKNTSQKDKLVNLDAVDLQGRSAKNPRFPGTIHNLAYVIYTSGSTGKPKGVMIEHLSLARYVQSFSQYFHISGNEVVLQQSSIAFDTIVEELYPALCASATVVIAKDGGRNVDALITLVEEHNISLVSTTPIVLDELNHYAQRLASVCTIISGGDVLQASHIDNLINYATVYNTYGPSESTVCASYKKIETLSDIISIGSPVPGCSIYILDENRQVMPEGAVGEICIAGNLARGYLGEPALSALKFIDNPTAPGQRLYCSGDLGRWTDNGELEFIGRKDYQVKVRGHRVEPEEIERVLNDHPMVKMSAVTLDKNSQYLVAWVVGRQALHEDQLSLYLSERFPHYMRPYRYEFLDDMPLTATGKLDRKALALNPNRTSIKEYESFIVPGSLEEKLLPIFTEVLALEEIAITDNFFELGGNSIKATRIITRIHKKLGYDLNIKEIFLYPTILSLASRLQQISTDAYDEIPAVQPSAAYALSSAQYRLWILSRLEKDSAAYNESEVYELNGSIDIGIFRQAFESLVERHEILRTTFIEVDSEPRQVVHNSAALFFYTADLSGQAGAKENATQVLREYAMMPFELDKGPLFRVLLLRFDEASYYFSFVTHHIISDGWSGTVFVKEWLTFFNAYSKGSTPSLQPLRIQYKDYACWFNKKIHGEKAIRSRDYWMEVYRDEVPVLNLPADLDRPLVKRYNGETLWFTLGPDCTKNLKAFCKEHNISLFMLLLSGTYTLLSRYSGQEDIVIGTPVAGRDHGEFENQIGFYINLLPLRLKAALQQPVTSLLEQVRQTCIEAYDHQAYPFDRLVNELQPRRDVGRSPLFDVLVSLNAREAFLDAQLGETVKVTKLQKVFSSSKYDVSFYFEENNDGIDCSIEYDTALYHEATIRRMAVHFENIVNALAGDPSGMPATIEYISKEEKHRLLCEFNNTHAQYSRDSGIIELISLQAHSQPAKTAIICNQQHFSYHEIEERSNRLAHYLVNECGVKTNDHVYLLLDRTENMVVSILATWKAGAAYVPVDPSFPRERVLLMLGSETTNCRMLTTSGYRSFCVSLQNDVSVLEEVINLDVIPLSDLPADKMYASPGELAYIMFTSGSTGKPKGVEVYHHSVLNFLLSMQQTPGMNERDVLLAVTTYIFDISVLELFLPLITGAQLVIAGKDEVLQPAQLQYLITTHSPTIMQATPSLWNLLIDHGWQGSANMKLLCGGEPLTEELKVKLLKRSLSVWNMYGPTETTIWSTCRQILENEPVTIGFPINNTSVYILDAFHQLVPEGIYGEICIAGDGVAKDYLNRPELTASGFVADPFAKSPGARMYKTGDLGKWLPKGELRCAGRIDTQIKIRGYRIEPGEIESVVDTLHEVAGNCVVVKPDQLSNNRLVCYYVPAMQLVQQKEQELYDKQLESWQGIYEAEYGSAASIPGIDAEFDTSIWKDSFTGLHIPGEQMREWVDTIAGIILAEKPQRVLEIGCGTGLIYYRIAGQIQHYTGIDFSSSCIEEIKHTINKKPHAYPATDLKVCAVHEVDLAKDEQLDTIILNSVVQYFPGQQYLTDAIAKSISLLQGSGKIIIGDVRDNRLLKLFKARLLLDKLNERTSARDLMWRTEEELMKEEELCISPEYFYQLRLLHPSITHIDIQWRQGHHINEMNLYRYNVILYVGIEKNTLLPEWRPWKNVNDAYIAAQSDAAPATMAFNDVPNPRLWKERLLHRQLNGPDPGNVRSLRDLISKVDEDTQRLNELLDLARSKGYQPRLMPAADPLKMNLLLTQQATDDFVLPAYTLAADGNSGAFTNIPLFHNVCALLKKDIRRSLQEKLPEYMVPSQFIAVRELPLTSNGKADRKFLSEREDAEERNTINFQAPRNEAEMKLAAIWQELLDIKSVSVNDNFFDLGGHSLKGIQLASSLSSEWDVSVELKDIFLYPTIQSLALFLQQCVRKETISIPLLPGQDYYDTSPGQKRLWTLGQLSDGLAFNMAGMHILTGELDAGLFRQAFEEVIRRHEILRTRFVAVKGDVKQVVKEDANGFSLILHDWRNMANVYEKIRSLYNNEIHTRFDLSNDPLIRTQLVRTKENEYVLISTIHHIISDAWSIDILAKDVLTIYSSLLNKIPHGLPALKIQYKDYAAWLNSQLQQGDFARNLEYWKQQFHNGVPVLELPLDHPRPQTRAGHGRRCVFRLDTVLYRHVQQAAKQHGVSTYMILLAAQASLYYKYTGQDDIVIGTPISGRDHADLNNQIGFYINNLPLRFRLKETASFSDFLASVKETAIAGYEHKHYLLEDLVEQLHLRRQTDRSLLYDVGFTWDGSRSSASYAIGDTGLQVQEMMPDAAVSQADIWIYGIEDERSIQLIVEYDTGLFTHARMQRFIRHFSTLLQNALAEPETSLASLSYLDAQELREILHDFNDTVAPATQNVSIQSLFEHWVQQQPGAPALMFGDTTLTYAELNVKANRLAHHLRNKYNVKQGDIVGILQGRSELVVICILAILKAGGAYVFIDPNLPQDRVDHIINDTGLRTLLIESVYLFNLGFNGNLFAVDLQSDMLSGPDDDFAHAGDIDDPAYVIYTSGSTGLPKGVLLKHSGVLNLASWQGSYFNMQPGKRVLQYFSYSFDGAVGETMMALLNGATLCMFNDMVTAQALEEFISRCKITLGVFVPSVLRQMNPARIPHIADMHVVSVGEACTRELAEQWAGYCHFYNAYGPTEYTVYSHSKLLNREERDIAQYVPVGTPVYNTHSYILDALGNPVGIGINGELYISGPGLAACYLNNAALTESKFISNPYFDDTQPPYFKNIYRTGDLCRYNEKGEVEFISRTDEQVKLRGYRIEIGEIENVLQQHPAIALAAVAVHTDAIGDQQLVAWAQVSEGSDASPEELKVHLKEKLPVYMVPARIFMSGELPLTVSGKIDKKQLLQDIHEYADEMNASQTESIAPRTETEKMLATLWGDVLDLKHIGIHDNFFELGGHSLKATRIAYRLSEQMGINIGLGELFEYPTIASLAAILPEPTGIYQSIPTAGVQEHYPVSNAQKRLWIFSRLDPAGTAYNICSAHTLEGPLDVTLFRSSFETIIARHEVLRTTFAEVNDELRQVIHKAGEYAMNWQYYDACNESDKERCLQIHLQQQSQKPFNLFEGPLMRCTLIKMEENRHVFVFVLHHIITDGWSVQVLIRELMELYDAGLGGREAELPSLFVQYKDYACWQQQYLDTQGIQQQKQYWLQKLGGVIPVLELPVDHKRPTVKRFFGATTTMRFNREVYDRIRRLCTENDTTLFIALTALVRCLLNRYTGNTDIILGTPVWGRDHKSLETQMGLYINTIALRSTIDPQHSFMQLLRQEKENAMEAYRNQAYPFDMLVEELQLERDLGRSPVFDVLISLQDDDLKGKQVTAFHGVKVSDYPLNESVSKVDLTFTFTDADNELLLEINYDTDLFRETTIANLANNLQAFCGAAIQSPTISVGEIDFLDNDAKQQLSSFGSREPLAIRGAVHEIFCATASEHPNAIALEDAAGTMSYAELDSLSSRFASQLLKLGLKQGRPVIVHLDRSQELIVALLGVFKAGGVYVPVDTSYPEERIEFILSDCGASFVLTNSGHRQLFADRVQHIVYIDQLDTRSQQIAELPFIDAEDHAYIIYTSGSTGKPKGVQVQHGSLSNFLANVSSLTSWDTGVSMPMLAAHTFDISLFQVFAPLMCGGRLLITPKEAMTEPVQLLHLLDRVNVIDTVPAMYDELVKIVREHIPDGSCLNIRHVFIGGDSIPDKLLGSIRDAFPNAGITVTYGPTEGTIFCTAIQYHKENSGANLRGNIIGRPLGGNQLFIADHAHRMVPAGVYGEICIGGAGVANGYLNRNDLTKEKFISDAVTGARLYCTGDRGRWLPDGTIEFLGREDNQVKLRGFRIETGEIESAIMEYRGIESCAVVVQEAAGADRQLAAFAVFKDARESNENDLRKFLQQQLPAYMIPAYIVSVSHLPLTSNGKVDRKALAARVLDFDKHRDRYVAPVTEIERALAEIFEEVLEKERVGITGNFFELGGHSLKAIRLLSLLQKRMKVELPLRSLFLHPTVQQLAAEVESNGNAVWNDPITPVAYQAVYETSSGQQRLWVLHQLQEARYAYNVLEAYLIKGQLEIELLQQAYFLVVERHEALRTIFVLADGEIRQRILLLDKPAYAIELVSLEEEEAIDKAVAVAASREQQRAFDLEKGPLVRVQLLKAARDQHYFFFTMHHIITDGWSMEIIMKELFDAYNALLKGEQPSFRPLPVQYKDYAAWQRQQLDPSSQRFNIRREYWLNRFKDEVPPLELPADFVRPPVKNHQGDYVKLALPAHLAESIKQFAQRTGSSLFALMTACIKVLLYRYTNQGDIVIGTPAAGRNHPDLQDQVGFYVNTLPVRTILNSVHTFMEVLEQVKENVLQAFEHQSYPFDDLVNQLNLKRDLSRSPLFDILVALHEYRSFVPSGNLVIEPYTKLEQAISKFDLIFNIYDTGDAIQLEIIFDKAIFRKQRVHNLLLHLEQLLASAAQEPHQPIALMRYMPAEEEKYLVTDLNNQTLHTYPEGYVIPLLLEDQVRMYGGGAALLSDDVELTYGAFNGRVNQLAHYLRGEHGILPGKIVALHLERSAELVIAVFGVLKAGGAYVYVDPTLPDWRKEYIIKDTGCSLVLTEGGQLPVAVRVIDLAAQQQQVACQSTENPQIVNKGTDAAYIIYTSGSTGEPKGVVLHHRGLVNLARWQGRYFTIRGGKRILQYFSFSFDGSVGELSMSLLNGGTLCMFRGPVGAAGLEAFINRYRVEAGVFVPSLLQQMRPGHIGHIGEMDIISVGEACSRELAETWSGQCRFYNGYGPTEATVYSHAQLIDGELLEQSGWVMPVGSGMDNMLSYVLDEEGRAVGTGVKGELYLSGTGVARGYLHRRAVTLERFVPNRYWLGDKWRAGELLEDAGVGEAIERLHALHRQREELPEKAASFGSPLLSEEELREMAKGALRPWLIESSVAYLRRYGGEPQKQKSFCRYFLEGHYHSYSSAGMTAGVLATLLGGVELRGLKGVELGFGNGEVLGVLVEELGVEMQSIDLSPYFVEQGLEKGYQVQMGEVDVPWEEFSVRYGIGAGSQDLSVCTLLLDRVSYPEHLLGNLLGMLKEGGRFALQALLPVVPFDDGAGLQERIEYTGSQERITEGRTAEEDKWRLIQLLHDLGGGELVVRPLELAVSSRDGWQQYELWSFAGRRERIVEGRNDYSRMYRTGDLCRYTEKGRLEYLGRRDEQVKLRGYRIELSEIEAALRSHELVADCGVVLWKDEEGVGELAACVLLKEGKDGWKQQLRAHVGRRLPVYMVPGLWMEVESIPCLSNSGKTDKRKLEQEVARWRREQQTKADDSLIQQEGSELEAKLVKIWESVLECRVQSIHDNFFELGGHSIRATRLMHKIYKELGVKIALSKLFEHSTIASQASILSVPLLASYDHIPLAPVQDHYPASHAQKRIWLMAQMSPSDTAYHVGNAYILEGALNIELLQSCFEKLKERHEILRTTFEENGGEVRQLIHAADKYEIICQYKDLINEISGNELLPPAINDILHHPFDLSKGPLIRAGIFRMSGNKHVLAFVLHHIITDGWSMQILVKELLELYAAGEEGREPALAPLTVQYKDYAYWQHEWLASEKMNASRDYWQSALANFSFTDLLPAKPDEAIVEANHTMILNENMSNAIQQQANATGATRFMWLLSAVKTLLFRYTGEEDITVGNIVLGRDHPDLENQAGLYVNTLALRSRILETDTLMDVLEKVKKVVLNALQHQSYPFDQLLENTATRKPVPGIVVGYQEEGTTFRLDQLMNGISIKEMETAAAAGKFNLDILFMEQAGSIHCSVNYNASVFSSQTIEQLLASLMRIIQGMLENMQHGVIDVKIASQQLQSVSNAITVDEADMFQFFSGYEAAQILK